MTLETVMEDIFTATSQGIDLELIKLLKFYISLSEREDKAQDFCVHKW